MGQNREYYEELINSSRLFELDPERDVSRYKVEAEKLKINLYNYLLSINKSIYENLAVEILETANDCIKGYKPEYGPFLHYFNTAMSKSRKKAERDEAIDVQLGAMNVSESRRRELRDYAVLEHNVGENESIDDAISRYAEAKGIDSAEVKARFEQYAQSRVVSDVGIGDEGEEISLIDLYIRDERGSSDVMEEKETIDMLLAAIDDCYCLEQERNKGKIAALLIYHLRNELRNDSYVMDTARGCKFFDEDIYRDLASKEVRLKDIADMFGVKESSLSRSWANFCKKVREKIISEKVNKKC